eukprot:12704248-Prorocentrum_lima.AAC.1
MDRLDVFQLKGLRKILHLKTTFVDRNNSNEYVWKQATQAIQQGTTHSHKVVLPLSVVYTNRKILLLCDILMAGPSDP